MKQFFFIVSVCALFGAAVEVLSYDMPRVNYKYTGAAYFILSFHAVQGAAKGILGGTVIGLIRWWRSRKPATETSGEGKETAHPQEGE